MKSIKTISLLIVSSIFLGGCNENININENIEDNNEIYYSSMGLTFEELNPYESFYIVSYDSIDTESVRTYAALGPDSPGSSSHHCLCGIEPFRDNSIRDFGINGKWDLTLNYDEVIYKGVGNGLSFRWNSNTKIGTFNFTKIGTKNFTITGYKVNSVLVPGGSIKCYCPIIVYNFTFNVHHRKDI